MMTNENIGHLLFGCHISVNDVASRIMVGQLRERGGLWLTWAGTKEDHSGQ